jgi:hypothetical protein
MNVYVLRNFLCGFKWAVFLFNISMKVISGSWFGLMIYSIAPRRNEVLLNLGLWLTIEHLHVIKWDDVGSSSLGMTVMCK